MAAGGYKLRVPLPPRHMVTTVYVWSVVVVGLVVAGTAATVVGAVAPLFGDRCGAAAEALLAAGYRWCARRLPYDVELHGPERLPRGPCILAANHQSYADVFYLYQLGKSLRFVVKETLFTIPLFGTAMRAARYLRAGGGAEGASDLEGAARRHVAAGVSLVIFPEGTRSPNGELGRLQRGAARLAISIGIPLVPIGIAGTRAILPKGTARYARRGAVHLVIGEMLRAQPAEKASALTHRLATALAAVKEVAEGYAAPEGQPALPPPRQLASSASKY